jgi:Insertion element 4 transposase N-terminal
MVDAVLAETGAQQRRVRDLPSRVVVYLLLAAALFADLGYGQVWARMIAGLGGHGGLPVAFPTAGALAQARRRVEPRRCGRCSTWSAGRPPECRCRGCAGRDGW